MPRAFLIHGYTGTPEHGWLPWLTQELETRGYDVFVPSMPETDHPRVRPWVGTLHEVVGEPCPDDVFVGHSLGCITIIRYLLSLSPGQHVGHCIFVAGFYEELGPEYEELRTFLDDPIDWSRVREACPSFTVIHSDDDDAVPVYCGRNLAVALGVPLELHSGYGHFSGSDGVTELPLLLKLLDKNS